MDHDTLEEIRQLKYRYLRGLDLKLWDEFADCLTPDVIGRYNKRHFDGRDAIVEFMSTSMPNTMLTVHQCHHPEITLDGDTAHGRWSLDDRVIVLDHNLLITGAAFYDDTYVKCDDGRWRISRTGYQRTYEAMQPLPEGFTITANLFATEQP